MVVGNPGKVLRTNVVGLQRSKITEDTIKRLNQAFKILFRLGLSKTNALEKVQKDVKMCPELEHLIFFCKTTERGLCS